MKICFKFYKTTFSVLSCLHLSSTFCEAQQKSETQERFTIHAQTTIVNQYKPAFKANYSGGRSLTTYAENRTSISATLFTGARLWKNASIYINPEIAGGSGLSEAMGIAAATNGETFRIGDAAPKIYLARAFFKQVFDLSDKSKPRSTQYFHNHSDFNQLSNEEPIKYLSLVIGKVSIGDYFDDNKYSHDPRTQFMCWALMSAGAWDYAANTRGYTPSIVGEWVTPKHELRYGVSLLPKVANGNDMNWHIGKSIAHTLEYTYHHKIAGKQGAVRILAFYNKATMGNYKSSIAQNPTKPNIEDVRNTVNTKYGFVLNAEQDFTDNAGGFARASWNDGQNETWAFTEIDNSLSAGLVLRGKKWKRANDNLGIAYVNSGLSEAHKAYLKAGGQGFVIGDGSLSYAREHLAEIYYAAELVKNALYLTGSYQCIVNPAYNQDRKGPVHVFSIRLHTRI